MGSMQGLSNPETGGILSRIVKTLATAVKATLAVPGRMDGRGTQEHVALAAPLGNAADRQTPTGPPRCWANPSSTQGGRPWPPAPPHWY
jgi:hypothetical protein